MAGHGRNLLFGNGQNTSYNSPQAPNLTLNTNGRVGINLPTTTTVPLATLDVRGNISASNAIQIGQSSLTCSTAISGSIRYSTTSSTMEYCNSTAWVSMGPSDIQVPAFKAYRSSTQSVADNTTTQVVFNAETFDTNSNFNTSDGTFTPTIAGTYILTANINFSSVAASSYSYLYIYKNGAAIAQVIARTGSTADVAGRSISVVAQANGTTDNFEVWVRHTNGSATNLSAGEAATNFSGALITMSGSGGGGGASPWEQRVGLWASRRLPHISTNAG
jgi:hypothetical protein